MAKRFNLLFICFCLIATSSFLFEIFEKTFLAYFIGLAAIVGYLFLLLNLLILIYEGMLVIVKNLKFEPPEAKLYYKIQARSSFKVMDYIYFVMKIQLIEFFESMYRGLVTGIISFFAFIFVNVMLSSSLVCLNFYNKNGVCFQTFTDYVFLPAVASIALFMYNVVLKTRPAIKPIKD